MSSDVVTYILSAAMGTGGMMSLIVYLIQRRDKKEDTKNQQQKLIEEGLLAVLHDRLYQACRYQLSRGYTTVEEMNNIKHLYDAYHALGGNGTGTELYMRCMALPIREDDLE